MGMRGGRGGVARGGMMGLSNPLPRGRGRGAMGRGGAARGGAGASRGTAMKRKAADTFSMGSDAKRMATGADPWSDDSWATQPIAQQPLSEAEWYQDTW